MTEQGLINYNRTKLYIAINSFKTLLKIQNGIMINPIKALDPLSGSKSTMIYRLAPVRRGYFYAYYIPML